MTQGTRNQESVRARKVRSAAAMSGLVLLFFMAVAAGAQDEEAETDSTSEAGASSALQSLAAGQATGTAAGIPGSLGLKNEPKAGVRANVRQFSYYSTWTTTATMARGSTARSELGWNWDEFRKQDKTVESRKSTMNYNFGNQLPLTVTIDGNWNWSEDRTTNTAGYANLFKVDNKNVQLNARRAKFEALGLVNSVRVGASVDDQVSLNQNQRNDFKESTASTGLQSGWEMAPGIVVAGRLSATTTGGTRFLGESTSPSSVFGDSVGVGVYFNRGLGAGWIQMTRSNFEKKYLEFRRNANGLIDTVGVDEGEKVLDELETKDAMTLAFQHKFSWGRLTVATKGSHTTDDLQFAVGVAGLKQKQRDVADLTISYASGRDSLVAVYGYGSRWDDQRIKVATVNRGQQVTRDQDFLMNWYRTLFRATRLNLQYHEGLVQDIAENRFNANDKDRMQTDFSARLDRSWAGRFRSQMVFAFRQSQDVSIRGTSSSTNNVKDSYELTPGFSWELAPWITIDQNYRLYIQYTDYVFSHLPSVTRKDDYNKRGDLTTQVKIRPGPRLTVTVRHDQNQRFNATKTTQNPDGTALYNRDLEQTISKLDLGLRYAVADGVNLEATTYRTRDDKTSIGRVTSEFRTDSGEVTIGGRLDRSYGAARDIVISAVVKKVNAYGPSVTPTSADYWEADVWLKWMF